MDRSSGAKVITHQATTTPAALAAGSTSNHVMCSRKKDVFHIGDLARDADTKLFRQASDQRHCLYPLLPAAQTKTPKIAVLPQKSRTQLHIATY